MNLETTLTKKPNDMNPYADLLTFQRRYFETGATRTLSFRIEQLNKLEAAVLAREAEIYRALKTDLAKPEQETFMSEIAEIVDEIRYTRKNLKKWMRPERVSTPLPLIPASSRLYKEPKGCVLIVAPWNYPLQLAIVPLIGSIAAGCCTIIKPSEHAPETAKLVKELIDATFTKEFVTVVEGGIPETTALLKLRYDHIFFTGSTQVGKIVAKAAAEHLTPVTLELGGKSPVIVTRHADLALAAKRIAWGKGLNAGQSCVAPDYVYVHSSLKAALVSRIKDEWRKAYGDDPKKSESLGRIVNANHYQRIEKMIVGSKDVVGGERDASSNYIEPTMLTAATWAEPSMQEEIFGPVLPIVTFETFNEVIAKLKEMEKPLAAYLFSRDWEEQERFVDEVSFGGGCINDTLIHQTNLHLPFGGVGSSGTGAYHGKRSFDTFTHMKGVIKKPAYLDPPARYAPYTPGKLKFLKTLFLRKFLG